MADWMIFDVLDIGTTAAPKFFAHTKDSNGKYVTNLTEANKLDYDFRVNEIGVKLGGLLTAADYLELLDGATLEVTIGDTETTVLIGPLFKFLEDIVDSVQDTVYDTDAHQAYRIGGPFKLMEGLMIPKDTKFNVDLILESASAAGCDMIVTLVGSR